MSPEAEAEKGRAMRELERLTPEQREKVWKAVMAVMNLPEAEQNKLLTTEEERRAKVKAQFEQTIKDLSLVIPDERRRSFFRIYYGGRRSIEEQLRKESDEKRTALTNEFHEKLKKDFGPEAVVNGQPVVPGTPEQK